ncbi:MAG: response regulator, partial [Myxococcota bacterium]
MASILVVEDERVIRSELRRVLKRAGYEVAEVGSVSEARQQPLTTFDLILTDLRLPGGAHGDALLDDVEGQVPVVLMTAFGSIRSAVDAMKRGAADYLSKPIDTEDLLEMVERVLASHTASNGDREGSPTVAVGSPHLDGMIGSSRPMQAVFRT